MASGLVQKVQMVGSRDRHLDHEVLIVVGVLMQRTPLFVSPHGERITASQAASIVDSRY